MSKGFFLGIDGGGTKTLATIVDARGCVLGTGLAGASNVDDVGVVLATANIFQAVSQARATAKLETFPFSAAFLGLAGVVSAQDRALVRGIAESLALARAEDILIDHDCRIALAGGLSGRPGIVLIAGTGSSCYGRNANGQTWRAGGWGSLISDEGSGYWLGREGLIATVRSLDGRDAPTAITAPMLEHLEVSNPDDLLHRIYVTGLSRSEIAALAPVVIEAARASDSTALNLIRHGSSLLAECVKAVVQKLNLEPECELVLVGGIFQAGEIIFAPFRQSLLEYNLKCKITSPELSPSLGACLLALEHRGLLTESVMLELKSIESQISERNQ